MLSINEHIKGIMILILCHAIISRLQFMVWTRRNNWTYNDGWHLV